MRVVKAVAERRNSEWTDAGARRVVARRAPVNSGGLARLPSANPAGDDFRRQFGLISARETEEWMTAEGITEESFTEFIYDSCLLEKLERLYDHDIRQMMPNQMQISMVRRWLEKRRST